MSKKKYLFSVIILGFLSFYYLAYKLKPDYWQINYKNKTTVNEYIVTKRYEWTLNTGILQYSSIINVEKNEGIIVEVLTFLNYPKENDILRNKNIKCLLLDVNQLTASEKFQIMKIPLMNTDGTNVALWKIKCKFPFSHYVNYEESKVSIVDTNEFTGDQNDNIFKNLSAVIPKNLIKYQKPTTFYSVKSKNPAVANCVHLVRGLDTNKIKRIKNWLEIQFAIGYKHITFYFFEPNEDAKRAIKEIYPKDKVIIIDYQTDIKQICKYEIQKLENYPNSTLFKNLHDICIKSYAKHFTMSKGYTSNAHERMNTNDCYMHYKYEYEYVTNYDFDEIIYPREFSTTAVSIEKTKNCTSLSNTNSIYDYSKRLFNKYGSKASCLLFDHVLFIKINETFFESLKNAYISNPIKVTEKSNRNIFFKVSEFDKDYVKYLLNLTQFSTKKCHNINLTRFDPLWNNYFAARINNRDGKSIFNTQLTEGINQHFTSNSVQGAGVVRVPISDGYSSHYRESVKGFFYEQVQSISFFYIDIEYYMFLVNLSN
jgi:hypothetical protein